MKRAFSLLLCLLMLAGLLLLPGCHGSRERPACEVPESFDDTKSIELTFWAKNDTNRTQSAIYEQAIRAFEAAGRSIDYVTARCPASLLRQPDMYAWMKRLLDELRFSEPAKLCLEFPRTLLYEDYEAVRPSLLALKLLKVRTLMTGCGERDCPVTALVELPVDMVLLAPRISALSDNRDKNHVFTGFIGFLRSLPVDVLGDGLYNDEQISIHSRADCIGYIPSAGYAGTVEHGSLRMTLAEAVSQKEEDV